MKKSIPFQVVELEKNSYHLLINSKIDNQDFLFVVDTGASKSVIDKKLVAGLKRIPVKNDAPIATGLMAEKIPIEIVSIPVIEIEGIRLKKVTAVVADLSAINDVYHKMTGRIIGGLIGCDILIKYFKSIDFRKQELKIKKKKVKK